LTDKLVNQIIKRSLAKWYANKASCPRFITSSGKCALKSRKCGGPFYRRYTLFSPPTCDFIYRQRESHFFDCIVHQTIKPDAVVTKKDLTDAIERVSEDVFLRYGIHPQTLPALELYRALRKKVNYDDFRRWLLLNFKLLDSGNKSLLLLRSVAK